MSNNGPGYAKNPSHHVHVKPFSGRVVVTEKNGEVLVDTRQALALDEAGLPLVYYVPRSDARMERLTKTELETYCPYKGNASYFSVGDEANVVWSYEEPYDEVRAIAGYLAFYANKVTIKAEPQ